MDEFVQKQSERLQSVNIEYKVLPNREGELERQWEDAFAQGISKSQKRKMKFNQCMWNVFSWGKIECLKEHQAIAAVETQKKAGCYLFSVSSEKAFYIPKANRLKVNDIAHFGDDLYLVDESFTWTYVLTHEKDCGPYFYKL